MIYYASADVVFAYNGKDAHNASKKYLKQQIDKWIEEPKRIESIKDIPKEWLDAIIYGSEIDDLSVKQYFEFEKENEKTEHEEWKTAKAIYLAGKDKFEK